MDKKIMGKWVKALESGKYKKGREALQKNDTFCCLGVLCDIYAKETKNGSWSKEEEYNGLRFEVDEGDHSCGTLPNEVRDWAGMHSENGDLGNGERKSLVDINDVGKKGFKYIAQVIKKNYKDL